MKCGGFLVAFILLPIFDWVECTTYKFGDSTKFGVATSSYQVEGAWNEDGKGVSIWDHYTQNERMIADNSTGNIACDSYHLYGVDIEMMKQLGVKEHRFSIAWTRILPTGQIDNINQKGLDHYSKFIDALRAAGIEPVVTIYHWDHPRALDSLGGWNQPKIITYITDYADLLFSTYGDRVKTWITLNEPHSICVVLTQVLVATVDNSIPTGTTEYLCGHIMLLAHASMYRLYQRKYKKTQRGQVGIALSTQSYLPSTDSLESKEAVERVYEHGLGWFLHPLVFCDYPAGMKAQIRRYSLQQGFRESRLPTFTPKQKVLLCHAYDFVGINNYISYYVKPNNTVNQNPSYSNDRGATVYEDPAWSTNYIEKIKIYTGEFAKVLRHIRDRYKNPVMKITEQGYNSDSGLNDKDRVFYFESALEVLWNAVHKDGIRITSYFMWSLMDSFEWISGYQVKMGLYSVNFTDPNRTRTPKDSAKFVTNFLKNKTLTVS